FRYSERENTIAQKRPELKDDVPEEVKLERLQRLIDRVTALGLKRNTAQIGTVHSVLVEGPSRRSKDEASGRSLSNKVLVFPVPAGRSAADLAGETLNVRVTGATSATLRGVVVED